MGAYTTCEVRVTLQLRRVGYNLTMLIITTYVSPLVFGVLICFILRATSIDLSRPDHNEGAFVMLMIINNPRVEVIIVDA